MGTHLLSLALLAFVLGCTFSGISSSKGGMQMRLTDKGLKYGMKVAIDTFEKNLVGKRMPGQRGKSGSTSYNLKSLVIKRFKIDNSELTNIADVGLRARVSDISIDVDVDVDVTYKWGFLRFSDSVVIAAGTRGGRFVIDLSIGSRSDGRPSMQGHSCRANVGDLKLKFKSGKLKWIYNMLSKLFKSRITEIVNKMICKMAIEEIRLRGDKELATFPVVKKIDKYASIDYRLTRDPEFTADYMDAYLKGGFFATGSKYQTSLMVPSFIAQMASTKMVYLLLTEYTFNTAGEVYQNSGVLKYTLRLNKKNIPLALKTIIQGLQIVGGFKDNSLEIDIKSMKAPKVDLTPGNVKLLLFPNITLKINGGKPRTVFSCAVDVSVVGTVTVVNDSITFDIKDFDYQIAQKLSTVGNLDVSVLGAQFIKTTIKNGILEQIKPALAKGIPLPTVDDIHFINSEVQTKKNVLVIGSDIKFVG